MHSILLFSKKKNNDNSPILQSALTDTGQEKLDKKTLKEIWEKEVLVYRGIMLNKNFITSGMKIYSDDPKVMADLSIIDGNTSLLKFTDKLIRDTYIFGTSFVEYLYTKDKKRITGLWNMDPVRVDFARDNTGKILVDSVGRPKKYIEQTTYGSATDSDEYGRIGKLYGTDKVTHFVFEELPGTIEGISALEPAYKNIQNKWLSEDGLGEAIKKFGVPIWVISIGDERHTVTRDALKKIKNDMVGITKKNVIVTPNWQKIELMQPKNIPDLSKNLDYYVNQICIALGIPRALLLETGEDTNRATLRQQIRLYISELENKREQIKQFFIKTVFKQIALVNGWDKPPEIVFAPITLEDVESFAKRVSTYINANVLDPDDVKSTIKRIEGFT